MKTFSKTLLCLALLSACSTPRYDIGMQKAYFLKHNHNATLVEAASNYQVYRINKVWMSYDVNYYYFAHDTLARIDQGSRRPDLVIQNNH